MANSGFSGLFQTVVAAMSDASQLLSPTHELANCIYWDFDPAVPTAIFQTMNVPIPGDPTSTISNVGTGDRTVSDLSLTTVPIVMNQNLSGSWPIRVFEQFNSQEQIKNIFMNALFTGMKNSINAQVAALLNTTNFTTNTAISTTSGVVTVPQFLGGQAVLADQYVPVQGDPQNMFFVLPSKPYTLMMDGTTSSAGAAWSQAFIVGEQTAASIHREAKIPVAFSTQFQLDQQMPTSGAAPSRTFTPAYFHRWAIAGATRPIPMPPEASKVVEFAYVPWGDPPFMSILVEMGYNQVPKGALIITISAGFGLKVIRENMCQLFSTAE